MPNHRPTKERLRISAKQMRRAPTDAEAEMWRLLRSRQLAHFKFRRQTPIEGYILDFVCFEKRLVVEIDGSQHASSGRDAIRSNTLTKLGFDITRYWNNDVVQQPQAVLEDILSRLTAQRP